MKQFEATICGTYITRVFKAGNLKEAKIQAKAWVEGIQNCTTKRFKMIELSYIFYVD